jgi:phosphatidylethanolamine-binding protein (PEBP) family uncharacterized protein
MALTLTSPAFAPGGEIPASFTCEGSDVSPALEWKGVPAAARSLVLIVEDPDAPDPKAPKMTYVHWVLYDMPPSAHGLPEGVREGDLLRARGRGSMTGNGRATAAPVRRLAATATSIGSTPSTRCSETRARWRNPTCWTR